MLFLKFINAIAPAISIVFILHFCPDKYTKTHNYAPIRSISLYLIFPFAKEPVYFGVQKLLELVFVFESSFVVRFVFSFTFIVFFASARAYSNDAHSTRYNFVIQAISTIRMSSVFIYSSCIVLKRNVFQFCLLVHVSCLFCGRGETAIKSWDF